jgi:zinc/manganese transport system ATP-binding protein
VEALQAVDAAGLAARPIASLSGGERQRVLIAQALLGQPKLLLLDEPLASLDPLNQQTVVQLLRDLQSRLGLTVLCSAHDLNVLLPVIDRVLYLGAGHAALGRVDDVVTAPTLSRLYGGPIDVVRAGGRIFVVPGREAA